MWYFTWVLGLAAALSLGIINVLWLEAEDGAGSRPTPPRS